MRNYIIEIIELIIGIYVIKLLLDKLFPEYHTYKKKKIRKSSKKPKITVVNIIDNNENFRTKELNETNYAVLPMPAQIVKKTEI
ncbi:MAG: hypothetical protein RMJ51_06945 [Candidatus Calescibacterium sp.]|nr:hypothetical protein [Candidatus Calescibacterium sp.]MDW8195946.1 hypothetical protein [Candidatus Calescibacterium sp.]